MYYLNVLFQKLIVVDQLTFEESIIFNRSTSPAHSSDPEEALLIVNCYISSFHKFTFQIDQNVRFSMSNGAFERESMFEEAFNPIANSTAYSHQVDTSDERK